jgi:hypothetical protein
VTQLQKRLKKKFNPIRDLGFIYGVNEKGVDAGVYNFCHDYKIPIAGITCFPWMNGIPDEAGKPPVYIAKDRNEFKKLMSELPHNIIVTGGRGYANVSKDNQALSDKRIPVDVVEAYTYDHISIPAVVEEKGSVDTSVENAAALIKALGCNPFQNTKRVKRVAHTRGEEHPDVFAAVQILKGHLSYIYGQEKSQRLGRDGRPEKRRPITYYEAPQ